MIEDCRVIKVWTRDTGNAPGINVSVWMAGCSHQCEGCFNPETWKWNQGYKLTDSLVQNILNSCDKPHIASLALLGGDPLFPKNRDGIEYLCKAFRDRYGNSKSIWLWTGYLWEDIKDFSLIQYIDIVVDGKFDQARKVANLKHRGSANQRIIDCKTGDDVTTKYDPLGVMP